jgi:Aspartyl/Asparaginyl beta-hydroxylase
MDWMRLRNFGKRRDRTLIEYDCLDKGTPCFIASDGRYGRVLVSHIGCMDLSSRDSARGELPPPTVYAPGHKPSEEHVVDLTAQPFWDPTADPRNFPWAAALEANSAVILEEFQEKLSNSNQFAADSVWQNQVMGEGWSAIRLQRLGVWNIENCQAFPKTYELLRSLSIPLAVRGVCFARQAPQSGVQPHSDGRNFILTSHLGLAIPDGCWIQVGNERRGWTPGKLTTLDTSFTHSTGNPSSEDRHVLILDFWHPELSEAERSALEFVYDLRNRFESGEIPVRKPRSSAKKETGVAEWWSNLTGGGGR